MRARPTGGASTSRRRQSARLRMPMRLTEGVWLRGRELTWPCWGNCCGHLRGRRADQARQGGVAQAKVGQNQSGAVTGFLSYTLAQLSGSKKARGPRPVAVIAAEDGTPLLDEARIGACWDDIFFQEFSGRGERTQQPDLEGRLRELRAPWRDQPCPVK